MSTTHRLQYGYGRYFVKRFLTLSISLLCVACPALAGDYMQGSIHIIEPWSRPLPAVSTNGAAYVTLMNMGDAPDKLVSASTPAAERAELHTHIMEGGLMKMRHVESIEIPAGGRIALEPGGLHIMLFGLSEPLTEGRSYPLTLGFERAGEVEVEVMVMEPADGGSQTQHEHGDMKHDEKSEGG